MMKLWKYSSQDNRSSLILCCAIIAAVTLTAFLPSLRGDFTNRDDPVYVTNNPDIRGFSAHHLDRIFSSTYVNHYLPVTMLSYMADYSIFGLSPSGWHGTNLALHLANSLLVFLLLFALSGSRMGACAAAVLFAVHPLRVEPVAWIAERKELLSAFFYLVSLLAWLSFRRKGGRRWYVFSLVSLLLSLLSKTMSVSQPFVLLLVDYLQGRKIGWKAVREKLPFFALSFLFMAVAILSARHAINTYPGYSLVERLLLPGWTMAFYLVKCVVPVRLCAAYFLPVVPEPGMVTAAAVATPALVGGAVAILRWGRRCKPVVFTVLFFLVTLAPVLQIVNSGDKVLVADRYSYLPLLGLYYLIALGLARLFSRKSLTVRVATVGGVIAVAAVLSLLTWQRCGVWKDSLALWNDILNRQPTSTKAYVGRGSAYRDLGQYDQALGDFSRAIGLNREEPGAWFERGYTYCLLGRTDQAIGDLREALERAPDLPDAWNELGIALSRRGEYREAIGDFTTAIQLKPDFGEAYTNRALSKITGGNDYASALDDLERAIDIDPQLDQAYLVRGMTLALKGDVQGAYADFSRSIALNPRSADAYFYRATLNSKLGHTDLAIQDLDNLIALDPRNAVAYNQRGIAHATLGRYDSSIADFDKAIELEPRGVNEFMQNRQRAMKLWQAASPARQMSEP